MHLCPRTQSTAKSCLEPSLAEASIPSDYDVAMDTHGNLPKDTKAKAGARKQTTGGTTIKKSVTPSQSPQGGGAPGTATKK